MNNNNNNKNKGSQAIRDIGWLAVACAAGLAACGGGSSPPTAVAPPVVKISVAPAEATVGQPATLTWSASDATDCVASGGWSGPRPQSGSVTLVPAAGARSYALECTGPGGKASASTLLAVLAPAAPAGANEVRITVDRGPAGETFNAPFASVTVCAPGTGNCRTVDRVLVDTGSVGLRLMAAALDNATALPPVVDAANVPVGACGQFVSGFTWGSLRRADLRLGGSLAANVPIQVISDSSAPYATIPSACRNSGFNQGTPQALGANGILGVSMFGYDCSDRCVSSIVHRVYFACAVTGCVVTALPLDSQISNPVSFVAGNNNGLSLELPSVPPGGASTLSGTLTFGIGTQANNQLGGRKVYPTDERGNFSTSYKGSTYTRAFIDSGSNGNFFDDPDLPVCGDFYCPPAPLRLTAANVSPNGATAPVDFMVDNINRLTTGIAAFHAAGPSGQSQTFDWGLPFFFGRRAFLALDGAQTSGGSGPYWAY